MLFHSKLLYYVAMWCCNVILPCHVAMLCCYAMAWSCVFMLFCNTTAWHNIYAKTGQGKIITSTPLCSIVIVICRPFFLWHSLLLQLCFNDVMYYVLLLSIAKWCYLLFSIVKIIICENGVIYYSLLLKYLYVKMVLLIILDY